MSLGQQVDDVQAIVTCVADRTQQRVLMFGISMGATISLLAAARDRARVRAMIAVSPDLQTRAGDAAVDRFINDHVRSVGTRRLGRALVKPPRKSAGADAV